MAETINLCAKVPLSLHAQVCAEKDRLEQTTSEYITQLLMEYYRMKENGGNTAMANGNRTLAFQIPDEIFQRIKRHLERETARTGKKVTQREFVLGLIEEALCKAEQEILETTDDGVPEETDSIESE